jgi:diaminohydroxyphosphoribosylaminopyrimidine deaminase / 5-amino-6-(5-phosphoribosylamino)uracil reductase
MDRPRITLKIATSLDGRIATAAGESRWITGEAARAAVHQLRGAHDGILIGSETAVIDDPELTVRGEAAPARQPLRVVLDSRLRLSPSSKLMRTLAIAPLLVIAARDADRAAAARLEAGGARIAFVPRGLDGLDLSAALAAMKQAHGVDRLLIEGGGRVAASFLAGGMIDAIEWFRAPLLLGAEGRAGIGPLGVERLADAPRFRRLAVREVGPDLWESYEREG